MQCDRHGLISGILIQIHGWNTSCASLESSWMCWGRWEQQRPCLRDACFHQFLRSLMKEPVRTAATLLCFCPVRHSGSFGFARSHDNTSGSVLLDRCNATRICKEWNQMHPMERVNSLYFDSPEASRRSKCPSTRADTLERVRSQREPISAMTASRLHSPTTIAANINWISYN